MLDLRFPWASNAATWQQTVEVTDELEGEPIDLSTYQITVWVVFQTYRGQGSARPSSWSNIAPAGLNYVNYQSPVLVANTSNGKLQVVAPGVFQWTFSLADMQGLTPGTYEIGATMSDAAGFATQLFVGTLPVIAGVVNIPQI